MVLCSGAFDGLHAGHVRYLAAAKKLAQPDEPVEVAIAPDDYVVTKTDKKPRWSQSDRWRTVLELKGLNPLPQPEASVADTIKRSQPRVFVKGIDWAGKLPADVVTACREVGALIVYVDTDGTHASAAYHD